MTTYANDPKKTQNDRIPSTGCDLLQTLRVVSLKPFGRQGTGKSNTRMEKPMRIYCAGAIRGEGSYTGYFEKIVEIVQGFGKPLTDKRLYSIYPIERYSDRQNRSSQEKLVAERDRQVISQCRAVVAEFSGASTGTGWEICYATRVLRKPALCLYNTRSVPSLIIKQDNSKYTIVQSYSNEADLEIYVKCFLEVVISLNDIDEIRRTYSKSIEMIRPSPEIKRLEISKSENPIGKFREPLVVQVRQETRIDFKDAAQLMQFLFRNLVLQKRWDQLGSQEIGTTFISGWKPVITKTLSSFESLVDISQLYDCAGANKIKYTREAFNKKSACLPENRFDSSLKEHTTSLENRNQVQRPNFDCKNPSRKYQCVVYQVASPKDKQSHRYNSASKTTGAVHR